MKKILLITGCLLSTVYCLLPISVFSQQLALSNQYLVNKFWASPAYAGAGGGFEAFGSFRSEWMNVPGAPETKFISANGIIGKNMGLGGSVSTLQAGIFTNIAASASYAYHLRLPGSQTLSFGLGLGLLESHVNLSDAGAQADPVAANSNVSALAFDASFGVLYRIKKLSVSFSAPRMMNGKIKDSYGNKIYAFGPHYRGIIGYSHTFNNDWGIEPTAAISMAENAPLFYDLAVPVVYKKKIWLAPIYKKTDIAIGIGGIPYSNFVVNYSYEFSTKGIMGESGGTHEITVGWKMSARKKTDVAAPDSKKPYIDWILK